MDFLEFLLHDLNRSKRGTFIACLATKWKDMLAKRGELKAARDELMATHAEGEKQGEGCVGGVGEGGRGVAAAGSSPGLSLSRSAPTSCPSHHISRGGRGPGCCRRQGSVAAGQGQEALRSPSAVTGAAGSGTARSGEGRRA